MRALESEFDAFKNSTKLEFDWLNVIIKDRDNEIAQRKSDNDKHYSELEGWKRKYADLEGEYNRMKADYES
jgi:hypothetical protein